MLINKLHLNKRLLPRAIDVAKAIYVALTSTRLISYAPLFHGINRMSYLG